jgi:hypothetical protein
MDGEHSVNITLKDDEVETLHGLLHDYLSGLKFEVARSDPGELRHILVTRQTLCERLLDELRQR